MNGKQAAGVYAAQQIENGMTVGLGTGSTVYYFLQALAEKVKQGLTFTGVATSQKTIDLAHQFAIPMQSLNEVQTIDITVDGADEVSPELDGIKGGGGALLYEKLVAVSSKKKTWIVDSSKMVDQLGAFPLPIEVIPYAWKQLDRKFTEKGWHPILRTEPNGAPFVTDAHHYILDLHLGRIADPVKLAANLDHTSGVVEHGLFLGMTDQLIIGFPDGQVKALQRI